MLLAAAAVALLAPGVASSAEFKRFITPSRNIGCFGDNMWQVKVDSLNMWMSLDDFC